MPEQYYTPFNGAGGQTRVTDMDRLGLQQQQIQTARDAAMMEIQARMQMQQAELGDRAQGRTLEYGDRNAGRAFEGGMFDKNAGLQRDLGQQQTDRAFGTVDRQMSAANKTADLAGRQFDEGAPLRQSTMNNQMYYQNAMKDAFTGGGQLGSAGSDMDKLRLMAFMATGGKGDMPQDTSVARESAQLGLKGQQDAAHSAEIQRFADAGDFATADRLGAQYGQPVNKPRVGSADIQALLTPKVHDFIRKDTDSPLSSALRSATSGAVGLGTAGALAGAAGGGIPTAGVGAIPGAALGGTVGAVAGGVGGAVKGLFSAESDPTAQEGTDIQAVYEQLVEALTRELGGNNALARQKAGMIMDQIGQSSNQGTDYKTDWSGGNVRDLYSKFR